jgi:protein gp37
MSENSKIEWTDHTFNPWEGCQKVGPGCDHCYAETRNARYSGGQAINWGPGAPRRRTSASNWNKPLAWNAAHAEFFAKHGRRQRVFCASLADVFDNAVDPQWRADLFELVEKTPHLDWLFLTKRIGNVTNMVAEACDMINHGEGWLSMWGQGVWPDNVWLGASIVNRDELLRDAPKLAAVPAKVKFWSCEPLLGDLGEIDPSVLPDWVIVGGESGPGARPMHPEWARNVMAQCKAADVAFLFKQWGDWAPYDQGEFVKEFDCAGLLPSGDAKLYSEGYRAPFDDNERLKANGGVRLDGRTLMHRVGKKAAGRLLDGAQYDGYPGDTPALAA